MKTIKCIFLILLLIAFDVAFIASSFSADILTNEAKALRQAKSPEEIFNANIGKQYWIYEGESIHLYYKDLFDGYKWYRDKAGPASFIVRGVVNDGLYYYEVNFINESPSFIYIKSTELEDEGFVANEDAENRALRINKEEKNILNNKKILNILFKKTNGDDIATYYANMFKRFGNKGEYEKTSDFEQRKAVVKNNLINESIAVFVVPASFDYNADEETMKVSMPVWNEYGYIEIETRNMKSSQYVGSNAFGASTLVTRTTSDKYVLFSKRAAIIKNPSFNMSVENAKKHRDNLKMLIICKPKIEGDYLTKEDMQHYSPTLDNPTEITYSIFGVYVNLMELLIYDFTTGEIIYSKYLLN